MKKSRLLPIAFCLCMFLGFGAFCLLAHMEVLTRQEEETELDQRIAEGTPDVFVNAAAQRDFDIYLNWGPTSEWDDALYSVVAPEGFLLRSYSKYWDEAKLQSLYEELLRNKHGEEINYLEEVTVYPEENENALASHTTSTDTLLLTPHFPALQGFSVSLSRDTGIISLYGGDTVRTVEEMARTLSHEYGHHFVSYYMFDDFSDADAEDVEAYIRLRGLPEDKVLRRSEDGKQYLDMHYWYVGEIAAEDYVLLMGSPATRQVVDFYDVRDVLYGAVQPDSSEMNGAMNLYPQENLMISFAPDVAGLKEYFYSFIDETPAPTPQTPSFDLRIEQDSVGYQLEDGYEVFVHYKIRWNKPYTEPGTVYTLLCYDTEEYGIIPIKTVRDDQQALAYIGTVTADYGNSISYAADLLDTGTKVFHVCAVLPDGTVTLSQPLTYTFD